MEVRPENEQREDEQEPWARTTCIGEDQPQEHYEERIGKTLRPDDGVAEAGDEGNERPEERTLSGDLPSNEKRAEKRKRGSDEN